IVAALRPLTPSSCSRSKILAADAKGRGKLNCHAAAASTGDPVDPGCLAAEDADFADAFANAEAFNGGVDCYTTGDAAMVEPIIDVVVDYFAMVLRPDPAENDCASQKLEATGRVYERRLRCHAAAVKQGLPPDPACLAGADATVTGLFAKVEAVQ